MPLRLGTSAVSLKLGTQSVTGYLGSQLVTATVPGAPTITALNDDFSVINVFYDPPASDGGSPITSYKFYLDGVLDTPSQSLEGYAILSGGGLGSTVEVSAVNAVGEGPKSEPVTYSV